jgi:hypothetical protein
MIEARFKLSGGMGHIALPVKMDRCDWRKVMMLFELLEAQFVCVPSFDEERTIERLEMGA